MQRDSAVSFVPRSAVVRLIVGVVGAVFVLAGAGLFVYLVVTTRGYASTVEYAIGLALIAAAAYGVFLVRLARGAH
ncbi:MAG: hypothetical protein ACRD2J_03575 [Thermoanaerobaculia bacterium]